MRYQEEPGGTRRYQEEPGDTRRKREKPVHDNKVKG